ncbi:MAG: glycerophosphoryl diester phosphodiesterase [Planctomycetota bacterium]|jgi:glycerophosphoryl diester phosphodiesterase
MPEFQLIAHRGFPQRYPDNSLSGIIAALDAGATYLEVDVQLSTSGTPYLFHDESLKRVSGFEGKLVELDDEGVSKLRASEAARFGEQFADEPIAKLRHLAQELSLRPEVFTFVEIKPIALDTFGVGHVVEKVAECLKDLEGKVAIISFSAPCLRAVRELTSHPIGLILETWEQLETDARELNGEYIFCNHEKLPAQGQIKMDAKLAVYEVIDPTLATKLVERGAQFVETFNYPEMSAALGLNKTPRKRSRR